MTIIAKQMAQNRANGFKHGIPARKIPSQSSLCHSRVHGLGKSLVHAADIKVRWLMAG